MRNLAACASGLVFVAVATAQTTNVPLGQPLTSPNQGNVGGGIYFDLTVNTTVTFVNLNYVAADTSPTGNSSLEMYVGPSTWVGNVSANPGPWTLVATTAPVPVTNGVDTPCTGVLSPAGLNPGPITFGPGVYGIALRAIGHSWGYQNGAFTFTAPGGQFSVATGGASNAFLALPTFSPRTINGSIDFTPGGTPMPFARRSPYGKGCYSFYRSIYELFPNSAQFDLSNTSMYWTFDPNNRWSSIVGGNTPVNTAIVTSPSLGHADNSNITITLANSQPILFPNIGGIGIAASTVEMCSNGYINLLGSVTPTGNPAVAQWINGSAVRIGTHYDMNPAGGGSTHYDYDAANQAHVFTWLAVPTSGFTGTNTMQIVFFANGDVEMRWGVMALTGGGSRPTLVGFTPGGASLDPDTVDFTASMPLFTSAIDQAPLALAVNANPVLGTTIQCTTSNATSLGLGAFFLSLSDIPGISPTGLDLAFLGAPGCVANIDLALSSSAVISNLGAPLPGMTFALPIPMSLPLLGANLFGQSVWLDPAQNPGGLITSNAMRLQVGGF
jgi:hypothetical protein